MKTYELQLTESGNSN